MYISSGASHIKNLLRLIYYLQDFNMVKRSPDHKQMKKSPILNQNEGIWHLVVKTIVVRISRSVALPYKIILKYIYFGILFVYIVNEISSLKI